MPVAIRVIIVSSPCRSERAADDTNEIGRGSGRERGEISGVAVSLKKKKRNRRLWKREEERNIHHLIIDRFSDLVVIVRCVLSVQFSVVIVTSFVPTCGAAHIRAAQTT